MAFEVCILRIILESTLIMHTWLAINPSIQSNFEIAVKHGSGSIMFLAC